MTAENFNTSGEAQNAQEVTQRTGARSTDAITKIAADYVDAYKNNPQESRNQWQQIRPTLNPDQVGIPNLQLFDNVANKAAIDPLLANNGKLFGELDVAGNTRQRGTPKGDGIVGQSDMKAWLNKHDSGDENYDYVKSLVDGNVKGANGESILNGDQTVDVDQLGRLTGDQNVKRGMVASDVAASINSASAADQAALTDPNTFKQQRLDQINQYNEQLTNTKNLTPFLETDGHLFDALDNAERAAKRGSYGSKLPEQLDGQISKGDMEAWLKNPDNDSADPSVRQFVKDLKDGNIKGANGESVLNGDGSFDREQLGRLTGNNFENKGSTADMLATLEQTTKDKVLQVQPEAAPEAEGATAPAQDELVQKSVATAGDGYIKVAARMLGVDNTDDPKVQELSNELQAINPGQRKDGMLNENESVLTADLVAQVQQDPGKFQVLNELLTPPPAAEADPASAPMAVEANPPVSDPLMNMLPSESVPTGSEVPTGLPTDVIQAAPAPDAVVPNEVTTAPGLPVEATPADPGLNAGS